MFELESTSSCYENLQPVFTLASEGPCTERTCEWDLRFVCLRVDRSCNLPFDDMSAAAFGDFRHRDSS